MTRRDFIKVASAGAAGAASETSPGAEGAEREPLPATQFKPAPDLGTHWDILQGISAQCLPDMSYLNEKYTDPNKWVKEARETLLDRFSYAPPACDPAAEVVETVDCGSYVRERLMLNAAPYTRIPAYLLRPKDLAKPAPGIIALHDHGGYYFWGKEKVVDIRPEHPELTKFKQTYYGGRGIADELARRGYVVIASDMLHWGERAMYFEKDPERIRNRTMAVTEQDITEFNARSWVHEDILGRTAFTCGATWAGVIASDDRRIADYLISRPEVDPNRVGCLGLSVGSVRTIFLGAIHPAVRASVAVCWMSEYQPMARNHVRYGIGFTKLIPGIYNHLDWPDIASLHWPGALMTISGLQDQLFPIEAVRAAVDKLHRIFDKAGPPGVYEGVFFDVPHEFNLEMQERAFTWLEEQLA